MQLEMYSSLLSMERWVKIATLLSNHPLVHAVYGLIMCCVPANQCCVFVRILEHAAVSLSSQIESRDSRSNL